MKLMRIIVGAALFLAAWAGQASAQYPGQYYFGEFYFRADGGGAFSDQTRFRSTDPDNPISLLGDDEHIIGGSGNSPIFNVGFGSQLTRVIRWDATLSYISSLNFSGLDDFGANSLESGKIRSIVGLVNGYLQIDGFLPPYFFGPFHPYVDAGVGVASNRLGTFNSTLVGGTIAGTTNTDLAGALGLGVSMDVAPHVMLDLSYRFLDLGEVRTGSTATKTGGATLSVTPLRAEQTLQTILLGLRLSL